jgi:hypothetical protein
MLQFSPSTYPLFVGPLTCADAFKNDLALVLDPFINFTSPQTEPEEIHISYTKPCSII